MDGILAAGIAFCLAVAAYPYLVYPALLALFARDRRSGAGPAERQYRISVLLSVFNEERVIEEKIRNFLGLDYPGEMLELLIASDGSTDRTEEIIRRFEGPRIRLFVQPRAGKTAALNRLCDEARGELLVFTDANTIFAKDAVKRLAERFADPAVGVVSGVVVPLGGTNGEGIFSRFEMFLKRKESALGVLAGADGAIYAIRKELYSKLEPMTINDLYHPIEAVSSGFKAVLAEEALAFERSENGLADEYSRQKRMTGQAAGLMLGNIPRLIAGGKLLLSWVLISHKMARWLNVPAVLSALLALLAASLTEGWLLAAPAAAYAALMVSGVISEKKGIRLQVVELAYKFQVVHIAYLHGLIDYFMGRRHVTWMPRGGVAKK